MVVALLVVVNVFGPGSEDTSGSGDDGSAVAEVDGQPVSPRDESPVEVATPPITPEADAACPALMSQLPLELVGDPSRRVDSDSPYAYAWGDPATTLVCGVDPALQPDSFVVTVTGLSWTVDTSDATVNVWTTTDRTVPVQVRIPASTDGAAATALGPIITAAIPAA
ncbi:MAG: uncharacterized protein JWQ53_409 [Klenkia sp.]|nr:uncharacterized protein [Klenkia sp.]